jgi:hypothetical protein
LVTQDTVTFRGDSVAPDHTGRMVLVFSPGQIKAFTDTGTTTATPSVLTGYDLTLGSSSSGMIQVFHGGLDDASASCLLAGLEVPVSADGLEVLASEPFDRMVATGSGSGEYTFSDSQGNALRHGRCESDWLGQELDAKVLAIFSPVYAVGGPEPFLDSVPGLGFLHVSLRCSKLDTVLLRYGDVELYAAADASLEVTVSGTKRVYGHGWARDVWVPVILDTATGDLNLNGNPVSPDTQGPHTLSASSGMSAGAGALVANPQVTSEPYFLAMIDPVFGSVSDFVAGSKVLVGSRTAYTDGRIDPAFSVNSPQEDVSFVLHPDSAGVYPSDNRPFMADLGKEVSCSGVLVTLSGPVERCEIWLSPNGTSWHKSLGTFTRYSGNIRYAVVSHSDPTVSLKRIRVLAYDTTTVRDASHLTYTGARSLTYSRGVGPSRVITHCIGSAEPSKRPDRLFSARSYPVGKYSVEAGKLFDFSFQGALSKGSRVIDSVSMLSSGETVDAEDVGQGGYTGGVPLLASSQATLPEHWVLEMNMQSNTEVTFGGRLKVTMGANGIPAIAWS